MPERQARRRGVEATEPAFAQSKNAIEHEQEHKDQHGQSSLDRLGPLHFQAFAIQGKGGRRLRLQTRKRQGGRGGSTLAWESPPRADFPQEILLNFAPAFVHEIRILCHAAKTPSSAEIHIGETGADAVRLGRIEFSNGIASDYTASEVKCISIQRTCTYIHLIVEGCFANARNPAMQAQISALVVLGASLGQQEPIETEASSTTTPRPRSSRVQSALESLRALLDASMHHVDRQHREQAEHMKQRLEGLEAAKERAVAAEDFARAAELKVSLETLAGRALAQLETARKSRAAQENMNSGRSSASDASFRAAQDAARALIFGPKEPDPFAPKEVQPETANTTQLHSERAEDTPSSAPIQNDPGGPQLLRSTKKRIRPSVRMPTALVKGGLLMAKHVSQRANDPAKPQNLPPPDPAQSQSLDAVSSALFQPVDSNQQPRVAHGTNPTNQPKEDEEKDGAAPQSTSKDNPPIKTTFPIEQWDLALAVARRQNGSKTRAHANGREADWTQRSMSDRSELSEVSTDELKDVEAAAPIDHVPQTTIPEANDALATMTNDMESSFNRQRKTYSPREQLEHQLKCVIEESISVSDWDAAAMDYAKLAGRGLASGRPKTVTLGLDLLEVISLRFAELKQQRDDAILSLWVTCTDLLRDQDADGLLHARVRRSLQTFAGVTAESAKTLMNILQTGTTVSLDQPPSPNGEQTLSEDAQFLLSHRLEVITVLVDAVASTNAFVANLAISFVQSIPLLDAASATQRAVHVALQRLHDIRREHDETESRSHEPSSSDAESKSTPRDGESASPAEK
ncbi:Centrosomal protein of 104 kDa [Hondaea fermentalgiana]|uniref:Centrosomal protein of 104 kDa n=1 Tax=Hondaea fermentalgiana TaxID=2315210 RepID=A0A2R5GTT2_9STRA|nr:Centrosomal protein of 104 kDa [Hondaea fermentalgiana]|eukprot:GBG31801.1 Centrosomal protein of 104 kDa [Hondaea fermentalgiana]